MRKILGLFLVLVFSLNMYAECDFSKTSSNESWNDPSFEIIQVKNKVNKRRRQQRKPPPLPDKESLVLLGRSDEFFSQFLDVLYCIHAYEKGYIKGLYVDFDKTGWYYDQKYGENWWEYYFEPIELGEMHDPICHRQCFHASNEFQIQLQNPELDNYLIIQKHIRIKPLIQSRIDNFVSKNFHNYFVIGVHYDSTNENPSVEKVAYEKMLSEIESQVEALWERGYRNYRIFLVTQDQKFLNLLLKKFAGKLCYIERLRTVNENQNSYARGEETLVNCVLLTKCDLLIRTASNLSAATLFFNPSLPSHLIIP